MNNHKDGFLVSSRCVGGVSEIEGGFLSYVAEVETGVLLESKTFHQLQYALDFINALPEDWVFSPLKGCTHKKGSKKDLESTTTVDQCSNCKVTDH